MLLNVFECIFFAYMHIFSGTIFLTTKKNKNNFFYFQLILVSVLNCLYDSVSHMLRKNVEKKAMLENLDGIFLAIDEICDNGLVDSLFNRPTGPVF